MASVATALLATKANALMFGGANLLSPTMEVTMAAPDIICLIIYDPPAIRGSVQPVSPAETGIYSAFVSRFNTTWDKFAWAKPIGPRKTFLKFYDVMPGGYLDRVAATNLSLYAVSLGGATVTSVYLQSMAYDWASGPISDVNGSFYLQANRHYLFLKLGGNLSQGGPYSISNPAFPTATFTFNDKVTRAHSIRGTQVGHRPNDTGKIAYLAVHIPAYTNEGAIDFINTYGLSSFQIIDANGASQFTGAISLRLAPTIADANSFTTLNYASMNTAPWVATNVTASNPATFTYSGGVGDPTNGQTVVLLGFGKGVGQASLGIDDEELIVSSVNTGAKTFTLPVNGTGWVKNSYLSAYDSLIFPIYTANRSKTYVFGLDYSAWLGGATGMYRIYIPGLGVSDPFLVSEKLWSNAAKNSIGGMYNQRNGIAQDGRFGFTKPAVFVDGQTTLSGTTCAMYKSSLPSGWTSEGGAGPIAGGNGGLTNTVTIGGSATNGDIVSLTFTGTSIVGSPITVSHTSASDSPTTIATALAAAINASAVLAVASATSSGPVITFFSPEVIAAVDMAITSNVTGAATETVIIYNSPWLTQAPARATGIYGGHRDAGDWPSEVTSHTPNTINALDIFEKLSAHSPIAALAAFNGVPAATNYGVPKSSQVLDPTLYAGTDIFPDVVHEALWHADFFRRAQNNDGSVPGMINFAQGSNISGQPGEASPYTRSLPFLLGSDHIDGYSFAAIAAKLSVIFSLFGFTTLAATWKTAAVNAWNWAEPIGSDTPAGSQDAYYAPMKATAIAHEGWTNTTYTNQMANMNGITGFPRSMACGAIYRLTLGVGVVGAASSKAYMDALDGFGQTSDQGIGIWEYCYANGATANVVNDFKTTFLNTIFKPTGYLPMGFAANSYVGINGNASPSAYEDSMIQLLRGVLICIERGSLAITSTSWSSGIATVTTAAAHGLFNTFQFPIKVAGVSRAGYNTLASSGSTYVLATSHGGSSFSYPLATDPGGTGAGGTYAIDNLPILALLQEQIHFIYGANQVGKSFTAGMGVRDFSRTILFNDAALGIDKVPPGLTCQGYNSEFAKPCAGNCTWSDDAPINGMSGYSAGINQQYYGSAKIIVPQLRQIPWWEQVWETPVAVNWMEFTIHQTMWPLVAGTLLLSGWDGNAP